MLNVALSMMESVYDPSIGSRDYAQLIIPFLSNHSSERDIPLVSCF